MSYPLSQNFGAFLLDTLGIDPATCRKAVITIQPNSMIEIDAELVAKSDIGEDDGRNHHYETIRSYSKKFRLEEIDS